MSDGLDIKPIELSAEQAKEIVASLVESGLLKEITAINPAGEIETVYAWDIESDPLIMLGNQSRVIPLNPGEGV